MSDTAGTGSTSRTLEAVARARAARQRTGAGWEAGKRVAFFIVLVLIMLVPLDMVEGVVQERADTKAQVEEEIGAQWGPAQTISGPVLVVPYEISRVQATSDGQPKTIVETRYAVFTPEELDISSKAGVQKRYKSIYEMLVYGADIAISGHFAAPDFAMLGVTPSQVAWHSASLVLGMSGVRAINAVSLKAAGSDRQIEAGVLPYHPFADGIRATVPLDAAGPGPQPSAQAFDFAFTLAL
ncbi:MAG TPA: inner membrane CreD family protein, partial [Dongiaceae bacterium]|nr:inner membrane CreD family protein [Dongiaceae bacterium]